MQRRALAQRYHAFRWCFGPLPTALAWFVCIAAFIHPPSGLGIPICASRAIFDTPCPGCGMSRSISSTAQGHWSDAIFYNPFGIPAFLLFAAIVLVSIMPGRWRLRLALMIEKHRRLARLSAVLVIAAFLIFGIGRALHHHLHGGGADVGIGSM